MKIPNFKELSQDHPTTWLFDEAPFCWVNDGMDFNGRDKLRILMYDPKTDSVTLYKEKTKYILKVSSRYIIDIQETQNDRI